MTSRSTSSLSPGDIGARPAGSGDTSTAQPAPKRTKRAQVSRACARCRRLQKKCSEERPCQRCIQIGLTDQCASESSKPSTPTLGAAVGSAPGSAAALPQTPSAPQPQHQQQQQHYESTTSSPTAPTVINEDPVIRVAIATQNQPVPQSPAGENTAAAAEPEPSSVLQPLFYRQVDIRHHLIDSMIERCADRFFARLGPTIPILTPEYVAELRRRADGMPPSSEAGIEAYAVVLGMCSMVLLQVEDPDDRLVPWLPNQHHGRNLLEDALKAQRLLSTRSGRPSFEAVLLTFFLYACYSAMARHTKAFFYLREATTLYLLLEVGKLPRETQLLAGRLYWVLLVSERSHAIRYRMPITLQVTPSSPLLDHLDEYRCSGGGNTTSEDDQVLAGLRALALLFRPLDSVFMALYVEEEVGSFPLAPAVLDHIEAGINNALCNLSVAVLHETQTANLKVTQFWLRITLWKMRLRLGQLKNVDETIIANGNNENRKGDNISIDNDNQNLDAKISSTSGHSRSYTFHYPLDVAHDALHTLQALDKESIMVHGWGITEKLYDIACAAINVLSGVPVCHRGQAQDDVCQLKQLIGELPGGRGPSGYETLLYKHAESVLPELMQPAR